MTTEKARDVAELDLSDIQGNVLRAYKLPVAKYVFLRVKEAASARKFLEELIPDVTTAEQWDDGKKPPWTLNIAFTHAGLAKLEVAEESLASFSKAFREGMANRAERILGDTGSSAPEEWESPWNTADGGVHVMLTIYATDEYELTERVNALDESITAADGVERVGAQDAAAIVVDGKPTPLEHFGYADGFGQPEVEGSGVAPRPGRGKLTENGRWEPLEVGEFLFGYPDEAGELPAAPKPAALAFNGTYLVYRKLHQKVALFRRYLEHHGKEYPGGPELLAAKFVGRFRDGTPLAASPTHMDSAIAEDPQRSNDFSYEDDPDGARVPLGAHIRRANPRDAQGFGGLLSNRRRIYRRGMPYGEWTPFDQPADDEGDHGLIFVALNASFERQFEFVMQEWMNNGNNFQQGEDKDVLVGCHDGSGKSVVPAGEGQPENTPPYLCVGLPRFVDMKGGDYFFLPGVNALRLIAGGAARNETARKQEKSESRSADLLTNTPIGAPVFSVTLAWLWVLQFLALTGLGFAALIFPEWTLGVLTNDGSPPLASDLMRISSAYILAMGLLTLFAIMTVHGGLQRGFATVFGLFWAIWTGVYYYLTSDAGYAVSETMIVGAGVILALANLLPRLLKPFGVGLGAPPDTTDTKPPTLWLVWLMQAITLAVVVILLAGFPSWTLRSISPDAQGVIAPVALDQARILAAWAAGVFLMTIYAMMSRRQWVWRSFAFFFASWHALWLLAFLIVMASGRFDTPVLWLFWPGAVFLALNLRSYRVYTEWFDEQVEPARDAWGVLDLTAGPIMAILTVMSKRRASHMYGVGASGRFNVVDEADATYPPNDFFTPGQEYPLQVRFATLTEEDDASIDVRGCSMKFSDQPSASPLDVLMNTGSFTGPAHLAAFAGVLMGRFLPMKAAKGAFNRKPAAREAVIAAFRRAPSAFQDIIYYSQIVRFWTDTNQVRHLVRYRCKGKGLEKESGLPSEADIAQIWNRNRLPEETRPKNYLREHLKEQLRDEDIELTLEAQFHTPQPGDTLAWFDATLDWPEDEHPWHVLGTATLTAPIPDDVTEAMEWDPGNHPQSLDIPASTGPFDPRSLGDSEERVVRVLGRWRRLMIRTLGHPWSGE